MTHTTCIIIDIKTAAGDPAAIHQVGIVKYIDSKVVWKYTIRIDPEGADGTHTFQDIAPHIFRFLHGEIVVSYGPLTRQAIEAAYHVADLDFPESQWIDCQKVIRRTWTKYCNGGNELENAVAMIRHSYIPGDALQDAQAVGKVFLEAIKESGYTAEAWVKLGAGMR